MDGLGLIVKLIKKKNYDFIDLVLVGIWFSLYKLNWFSRKL